MYPIPGKFPAAWNHATMMSYFIRQSPVDAAHILFCHRRYPPASSKLEIYRFSGAAEAGIGFFLGSLGEDG